jgi:hypothetical protein
VFVVEDAELSGETLTSGVNMCGARHRCPEPTLGSERQPVKLFVGQDPVGFALHVGEWCEHELVGHCFAAAEREWFVQQGMQGIRGCGGACRRSHCVSVARDQPAHPAPVCFRSRAISTTKSPKN